MFWGVMGFREHGADGYLAAAFGINNWRDTTEQDTTDLGGEGCGGGEAGDLQRIFQDKIATQIPPISVGTGVGVGGGRPTPQLSG